MAELQFDLDKGIRVGDITHVRCVLREATVGDLMRAARKAELVVLAPTGRNSQAGEIFEPAVLINPYLMEILTLRYQVVSIGEIQGPLEDLQWELLSETDIALIKANAELLGRASTAPSEVALRGRTDEQRQGGGGVGQPGGAAHRVDAHGDHLADRT